MWWIGVANFVFSLCAFNSKILLFLSHMTPSRNARLELKRVA